MAEKIGIYMPGRLCNTPSFYSSMLFFVALWITACDASSSAPKHNGNLVELWGGRGQTPGQYIKPRALVIDHVGSRIYIVDMTARIQVLSLTGQYIHSFQTPESALGKPTGLGLDIHGNLLVADTHYHRILRYNPTGELIGMFGEYGTNQDQFVYATDVVSDSDGFIYVSQYGDALGKYDRIQKFDENGKFVLSWGERGIEPGQFERPMSLAIHHPSKIIFVADACNHRIQCFNLMGKLISCWGTPGTEEGQLSYPYGLALDPAGNIYVSEFGNNRIQKFSLTGHPLGIFGLPGKGKGMFANPWDVECSEYIYVADALNHRIQKISPAIFENNVP